MDFTMVEAAIGSIGFPIVMCFMMFYYMHKIDNQHKEDIDKLTEALTENTRILTELSATITTLHMVNEKTLVHLQKSS